MNAGIQTEGCFEMRRRSPSRGGRNTNTAVTVTVTRVGRSPETDTRLAESAVLDFIVGEVVGELRFSRRFV